MILFFFIFFVADLLEPFFFEVSSGQNEKLGFVKGEILGWPNRSSGAIILF